MATFLQYWWGLIWLILCLLVQALQALQRQPNAAQYFQQLMLQQQINSAQFHNLAAVQQVMMGHCKNKLYKQQQKKTSSRWAFPATNVFVLVLPRPRLQPGVSLPQPATACPRRPPPWVLLLVWLTCRAVFNHGFIKTERIPSSAQVNLSTTSAGGTMTSPRPHGPATSATTTALNQSVLLGGNSAGQGQMYLRVSVGENQTHSCILVLAFDSQSLSYS